MGAKILLVDDDPATMSGLVALLQNAGYDVIAVSTMHDARRALVRLAPDLLITDVRLGAHNGLNLLVIRPQPIPAIVITGFDDPVLEADARRMGAEFLVKPIEPARLVRLIERMLSPEDDKPYETARRWQRKRLTRDLPAQVGQTNVRVVDVSYGGFRLSVDPAPEVGLEPSFQVTFPTAALSVSARVVWEESRDQGWVCGAVVTEDSEFMWRQFVDAAS